MENKKYFAFISYSHKDSEMAKWLQHELEYYELPAALFEKRKDLRKEDLPKSFRPVFRDEDELAGGELKPQIIEALADSEYLIVVCSPNAVASDYVDSEIQEFIKQSEDNKKKIFPFIIEGKPHQDENNKKKECFPETLRKLSEDKTASVELIAGDINVHETGKGHAFVKIVAGMLREKTIKFADLWDRYEFEKVKNERIEREKKEKLQIAQSRFVAEKAEKLVDEGDSYLARLLALEVLPKNIENPERPLTIEAELLIRKSLEKENAVLTGNSHYSAIASVYNNDGSRIYSIGTDGYMCVWDATNGSLLHRLFTCKGDGHSLCLSPDSTTVVTATGNCILMWNADTLKQQGKPLIHPSYVLQVVYSSNGEYIYCTQPNGSIMIWDKNGVFVSEFKDNDNIDFKSIEWMNVNKDNRLFTSTRESLNFWDINDGKIKYAGNIMLPIGRSHAMKFSSDGKYMVASINKDVYIWDACSYNDKTHTYSLTKEKPLHHKGDVLAIDISPDNRHIVVGADNYLYIWTCVFHNNYYLSEWKETKIMEFDALIDHICYHKEKNILVVSFSNSDVKIIDFSTKCCHALPIAANSMDFSLDGKFFAVVSRYNYTPIIYNAKNYKRVFQAQTVVESIFKEIDSENRVITFHENGDALLTMSDTINKWKVENVSYVKTPQELIGNYDCCYRTISRNGKRAIFSFRSGKTLLINADDNSLITLLKIDTTRTKYPYPVASFSHDSKYIATTSKNGDAKIWDALTGEMLCELPPVLTPYWGNSIEFSKDGTSIISANQNKNAIIWKWDAETNHAAFFSILEGHNEKVTHASFNNDGRLAVTASPNKIIIWDVSSCTIMKEIEHADEKMFVCFSPDSKRILSSNGESLFVWDYPSLQEIIDDTWKHFENRKLTEEERKQYYLE